MSDYSLKRICCYRRELTGEMWEMAVPPGNEISLPWLEWVPTITPSGTHLREYASFHVGQQGVSRIREMIAWSSESTL